MGKTNMSDEIRPVAVRNAYPFGTVLDIPDSIPDLAEHPNFEGSGRENRLLEAPDQCPTVRGM